MGKTQANVGGTGANVREIPANEEGPHTNMRGILV